MGAVWPQMEQVSDHGTAPLLEAAALQPGERVVDVGCGGGRQTLAVAQAVGSDGHVLGLDISPQMIELAQARVSEAGATNASFRVADVQTEPFEPDSFDVAVSQFGCMFFDEPERAFANLCSALVPGGRIAFMAWQAAERMTWMPNRLLAPLMPESESPINPHALAEADYVQALFSAAGFTDITSTELDVEAQLGDTFIQDAFTVDLVLEEHKSEARALVEQHKAQFRHGDGYRVVLPMLVIQATKPAS